MCSDVVKNAAENGEKRRDLGPSLKKKVRKRENALVCLIRLKILEILNATNIKHDPLARV